MIEARGLAKRYGGTVAVDDLSFTVPPGQVTGFLGPNGAGKSTTMRLILGLDAPDCGSVTIGGRPYAACRRPLFQAGALLEAKAFHGGRSARDHLLCLALSNGIGRARVDEVLDLVGLRSTARRRAGGFSLGMSQRLGIAAALLTARGATVIRQDADTLAVTGTTPEAIGELARAGGLTLTGLAAHQATLEDRYMELTRDAADYRAASAGPVATRK